MALLFLQAPRGKELEIKSKIFIGIGSNKELNVELRSKECEDKLDLKALEQITDEHRKNAQPWEDVKKELGWNKLK